MMRLLDGWPCKSVLTSQTKQEGGSGVLLGGVPGCSPKGKSPSSEGSLEPTRLISPLGLGAQVTILDISAKRIWLFWKMSLVIKSKPLCPTHFDVGASVRDADVVIGACLIPGAKILN